jgi:hypothetical protein
LAAFQFPPIITPVIWKVTPLMRSVSSRLQACWKCWCLLGLIPLLSACSLWRGAPIPKAEPQAKITLPAPPALEATQVLGLFRLQEPNQFLEHAATWISRIDKDVTPDQMRADINKNGFDLAELEAGKPAGALLWDEAFSIFAPPATLLLPAKNDGAMAKNWADKLKMVFAQGPAGYSLLGTNAQILEKAKNRGAAAVALVQSPMGNEAELAVNLIGVLRRYGAQLDEGLSKQMSIMESQAHMPPAQARLLKNELALLRDQLGKMEASTLGVSLPAEAIQVTGRVYPKPDTLLSKALQSNQRAWPNLAQLLPPAMFRLQMNIEHSQAALDYYIDMTRQIYAGISSDTLKLLETNLQRFGSAGPMAIAESVQFTPAGMRFAALALADNPKALENYVLTTLSESEKGAWLKVYQQSGIDVQITPGVTRKVRGFPVHQYKMSLKATDEMPEISRKQIEKLFGAQPINFEFARMGKLVLFSLGDPLEALANRIYAGKTDPLQAPQALPPGLVAYGDVRIQDFFNNIALFAPENAGVKIPKLPDTLVPVSFGLRADSGRGEGVLSIPKSLVTTLANLDQEKH